VIWYDTIITSIMTIILGIIWGLISSLKL